jgi:hypothetical protein
MGIWVILLWVIASLMACWSFSLFVRWVSEAVARRRKRLVAQRSARSFWLGLVLMFVCATVALFAAAMAIHLERLYTDSYDRWTTPVAIIGGSIGLFGVFVLVWAIIGDRPRGRVRCPKCWYDMSDAAGLQCPECGRTAKSARQFKRSQRARWAFVVAIGMFGLSGYGFSVHRRVADTEWLAAVPSWFLMMGWELLPEEWIVSDNSPYESTLDQRFDARWDDRNDQTEDAWVSSGRARRFGRKLTRGMVKDRDSRWDARQLSLIGSTIEFITYTNFQSEEKRAWTGLPIDADELFMASAEDLIDAFLAEEMSKSQEEMLEQWLAADWDWAPSSPYALAKTWLFAEVFEGMPDEIHARESENYERLVTQLFMDAQSHLQELLVEQRENILSTAFTRNLTDLDESLQQVSFQIAKDSGLLDELLDPFLDTAPLPEKIDPETRARIIAYAANALSPEGYAGLMRGVQGLVESGDQRDLAHVMTIFDWLEDSRVRGEGSNEELYESVFALALDRAIENHKPMYPDEKYSDSFHEVALEILIEQDVDGDRSYPLVLNELLGDPSNAPDLRASYDPFDPNTHIKAWVENFAQLADDDDPDIREWLISNLPVELGTEYDELIDQIAAWFLDDPDEDLREMAREKLMGRLAEHLLTQ